MHSNWRDVDAWRKEGLPMSTTSNEAAKMFDATISQWTAHADDPVLGGLESSVNKMLSADPDRDCPQNSSSFFRRDMFSSNSFSVRERAILMNARAFPFKHVMPWLNFESQRSHACSLWKSHI
ncbi:uncharacterized protein [Montipora capricornis]|uniref:uncharacterized protein n=1 Tax=Montipora capricornis TaxID=246305 RepID=UPI0035F20315